MIEDIKPDTAKAKLALSRAELLGAMGYEQVGSEPSGPLNVIDSPGVARNTFAASVGAEVGRRVMSRWWRGHPLSSVVQLGQPLLERYAQRHPGRLVAYGARTGALLWILRPWKLLSVATVVTLVFKSSAISSLISEVVDKVRVPTHEPLRPPVQRQDATST